MLADRVGIIDDGKIVAEGTPTSLKAEIGRPHLEVRLAEGEFDRAEEVVARFGKPMPAKDGAVCVELEHGAAEVAPVVRALDEAGLAVESLDLVQPTLDDVFVAKTGYHLEGDERARRRAARRGSRADDVIERFLVNARVVGALGARSVKQTFRRPQLMAPIIIFPTLLLAIQTSGAGGAVGLEGFPEVNGFLDFMLAGAMIQSTLLAGNSGGIALAVDIEMGFTDRLLAAPISRFAMVLGRLAGTAALGAATAVWFIVIGLVFGVTFEEGIPGVLLMILFVSLSAVAFGAIGSAVALRTGTASVVQGLFPLVFVDPLPLLGLLPRRPDPRAGRVDRRVQPAQLRRRGRPRPDDLGAHRRDLLEGGGGDRADHGDRDRAERDGSSPPVEDRRLMEARSIPVTRSFGSRADVEVIALADPPRLERDPPRPRRGDPRRARADDLLPRPDRGLRQPAAPSRLRHRQLPELHDPGQPDAGRGIHRRRDRRQPRPRHRVGLVRPPARLPRPTARPAHGARPLGELPGARPRDGVARRRLLDRCRLARDRRPSPRDRARDGDGPRRRSGARRSRSSSGPSRPRR